MEIVRRFLPDLGKKHYGLIARELHATLEEVQAKTAAPLHVPARVGRMVD